MVMNLKYCVVAGMGRSGTNYILDLLDFSASTICRNEPDAISGSNFSNLNYMYATQASEIPKEFKKSWTKTINEERYFFSVRDRSLGCVKNFMTSAWSSMLASWLLTGQRRRNALKLIWPTLSGNRYSLPHLLIDNIKLKKAMLVIKINMKLGWMLYLVRQEPSIPVIHVIRHPAGYFASMKYRYITKVGEEIARKGAIERLQNIAGTDPVWCEKFNLFGPIKDMSMIELSLCWWWCFNETLYMAASDKEQYLSLRFEDVVRDPVICADNIYKHVGIVDATEALKRTKKLANQAGRSKQRHNNYMNPNKGNIDSWRKKLSEQEIEVAYKILRNSKFSNLWKIE